MASLVAYVASPLAAATKGACVRSALFKDLHTVIGCTGFVAGRSIQLELARAALDSGEALLPLAIWGRLRCHRQRQRAGSVRCATGRARPAAIARPIGMGHRLDERKGHALRDSGLPVGEDGHSPNPFIARRFESHGIAWARQISPLPSGLFELGPSDVPGAGMRLPRRTLLTGKTVLGRRCLSSLVGLRCVSFPVRSQDLRRWGVRIGQVRRTA
jgi:hypothetical protein